MHAVPIGETGERMRLLLAVVMLSCGCMANAFGQQASAPDSCGAETSDLAAIMDCRRSAEDGRDRRCAAPGRTKVLPPTSGPRVLNFGEKTQYGSTSKGVVFEGGGRTVVAPSAGRVLFAGDFRSYGKIVIIDACTIDVLVAGIETVATQAQALVAEGQDLGSIAGPDSVVYLEVRRAGRPIDPFGPLSD
jgi:septal ring factor EnvC (AmiA/AmiB activator)